MFLFCVFFHRCRSFFTRVGFMYVGLFSRIYVSFIYVGLLAHMWVSLNDSFDIFGSLCTHVGLFPHVLVSFHMCRSLFTHVGSSPRMLVSFHICWSLFTYVGLFSHVLWRSLGRSLEWSRYECNFPAQICVNIKPDALC